MARLVQGFASRAVNHTVRKKKKKKKKETEGMRVIMSSSKVELKRLCYLYRSMPEELVVLNAQTPSMHDDRALTGKRQAHRPCTPPREYRPW